MHFYDDPGFSFVHDVEEEYVDHILVEDDDNVSLVFDEEQEDETYLSDDEFELKCEEERIRIPRVNEHTDDED